jgi:beta-xylosidase
MQDKLKNLLRSNFYFILIILFVTCRNSKKVVLGNEIDIVENINNQKTDSITIGELFTFYKLPFAYDHSIIHNINDKKWHLYGIQKRMVTFIHLTADSLTQREWVKENPFSYKQKEIWAPHIIEHDELFYMFYTSIGVPREIRYAVSKDLYEWTHPTDKPLLALSNEFTDNMKNKDPMVLRVKDKWVMYYSMLKDDKNWVVGYSTSPDLKSWSAPKICFDEETEEPSVESPFVVQRGSYYYLFLSGRPWPIGGEDVFRSKSPFRWKTKDRVKRIDPWHAAEFVRDLDGKWYLTRSSGKGEDFRMAPFNWNDGFETKETSLPIPNN